MSTKKLFLSLTLGVFIGLGSFSPVLADPMLCSGDRPEVSAKASKNSKVKTYMDFIQCKGLTRKELVNKESPYGLDLKKVYQRQKLIRAGDLLKDYIDMPKGDTWEVSSDIENLQNLKHSFIPRAKALEGEIPRLANDLKAKMKAAKEESNPARKAALEGEAKDLADNLTKKQNEIAGFKSAYYLNTEVARLEGQILKALGEFGLTAEKLKALPPVDVTLKP
jgi:hypothetical protein